MYENKLDNGSTVLGLFATPVYTTNIPPELSVAANFFDKLKHKEGDKVMEYGSHSENSYVMHEPECKELGEWIMTHVKEFGTNISFDREVRVHDSTADMRYLVLPMRPKGSVGMTEDELVPLIGRDAMIGVAEVTV